VALEAHLGLPARSRLTGRASSCSSPESPPAIWIVVPCQQSFGLDREAFEIGPRTAEATGHADEADRLEVMSSTAPYPSLAPPPLRQRSCSRRRNRTAVTRKPEETIMGKEPSTPRNPYADIAPCTVTSGRPGLSQRDRSLVTMACLVSPTWLKAINGPNRLGQIRAHSAIGIECFARADVDIAG
jgi:hypothetical protein